MWHASFLIYPSSSASSSACLFSFCSHVAASIAVCAASLLHLLLHCVTLVVLPVLHCITLMLNLNVLIHLIDIYWEPEHELHPQTPFMADGHSMISHMLLQVWDEGSPSHSGRAGSGLYVEATHRARQILMGWPE